MVNCWQRQLLILERLEEDYAAGVVIWDLICRYEETSSSSSSSSSWKIYFCSFVRMILRSEFNTEYLGISSNGLSNCHPGKIRTKFRLIILSPR
jgi:hypothetical protein